MGSEPPTEGDHPDERADEGQDDAPDDLLATAQELAGADEGGVRPRMRRGRARRRGRSISEDGAEAPREPSRVRSTTDEAGAADTTPPESEREMLDATGAVLTPESATARPPTARAIDAGAVLAEAVRSYLDGLDTRGAEDAVTQDRLDRLRRTLEQYDQAT